MISTSDFKNGITIKVDDRLMQIVEFLHVKPGKGGAFVRSKLKDINTGQVLNKTFRAGEKFEQAYVERKLMQYLYKDDTGYWFMDNETYEQIPINETLMGDTNLYIKENMEAGILFCDEKPLGVEPPLSVELEITETEPAVKGDTVSGATKPATTETGLTVQVPLFVNLGDVIKIDTREGKYLSRA